jgi:hypothetical protein
MVMSLVGLGTTNHSAVEDQKQFTGLDWTGYSMEHRVGSGNIKEKKNIHTKRGFYHSKYNREKNVPVKFSYHQH